MDKKAAAKLLVNLFLCHAADVAMQAHEGLERMRADYEQGERRVPGASKNLPRAIRVK